MNSVEHRKHVEYQKSKAKNVNKLWQKLFDISKYQVSLRDKKAYINKSNIIYFGALKCGVVFFCN